jgi:hypothetical protein
MMGADIRDDAALAIRPRTTPRTGRVTTSGMTHVMGGS